MDKKHNIYWIATDTVSYYCDYKEEYKKLELENQENGYK